MIRPRWWLAVATFAVAAPVLLPPRPVLAVPAFARRYGTSCQTCHVVFPKLTPFGEAFRRNGHHFPGGQDEDYRRIEPQKLGADAYKDVFPLAVWPGELPSEVPISAFILGNVVATPAAAEETRLAQATGSVGVNATASFGEWLGAWAGASLMMASDGRLTPALERVFLTIKPTQRPWGVIKLGLFEPGLLSISSHRSLGPAPWILTTAIGNNNFTVEPTQLGVELNGVAPGGRGSYAIGLVEGAANQPGIPQDIYGRLAFKAGGMRLDGEATEDDGGAAASPAPWREWSAQVGAFAYLGAANIGDPNSASQDDRFYTVGGDINANLRDANVTLAYSFGRNRRPFLAAASLSADNHQFFAQIDYVVFPWLVPGLRIERRIIADQVQDRMIPMLYVLWRANIRTQVIAIIDRTNRNRPSLERLQAGFAVGF